MGIAVELTELLNERDMTSRELARIVGMSEVNLSRMKTNRVRSVRFSSLEAICDALSCQPGDLLKYIDDGEEDECDSEQG